MRGGDVKRGVCCLSLNMVVNGRVGLILGGSLLRCCVVRTVMVVVVERSHFKPPRGEKPEDAQR